MKWEIIDKDSLPEGEVLAANFKPGKYGYKEKLLGYLHMKGETVVCENENGVLENCTHFIEIHKYDVR